MGAFVVEGGDLSRRKKSVDDGVRGDGGESEPMRVSQSDV